MFCLACHFVISVRKDIGHVRLMNASPLPRSPEALFPPAHAIPEAKLRRSTEANAGGSSPSPDQAAMLERRGSWSLNDFDIGPKLGEGQFGKIYLCREKTTKYAVVLKLIAKEAVIHNALVHQIQREIELHMYCKHRNVVRLLAYFWDDERVFLVLDYADEGNLTTLLQRVPDGQRLSEWAVRSLAGQLCSAVLYLHRRGILHRDIKPDNILFKKGCLKLADFTWAVYLSPAPTVSNGAGERGKSALLSPVPCSSEGSPRSSRRGGGQSDIHDAARRRRRTTFCGTLDYLPPELVMQRAYDEAADMWCVGATVYEMIVGRPPFEAVTMRETEERIVRGQFQFPRLIRDQLSWEAMDFVSRLLQIDPTRRMTAEQAARHPFVAGILEQERQRSLSTGRHRSAVPSSIFLPPTANDRYSHLGERIVRQHIHPLHGTTKANESKGALHFSGVSVSACTTILGGNNASSLSAAHPGNTSSSMVAPHPHATSTSVAGVSQMSHIAHHSGMVSSGVWMGASGESAGGTTLTNSQLPSNVTQASTQEGHDDAVAAAGDAFPLSVPDVSNITAAPQDDALPPPVDVERALEFDMALVPMHESHVDGPSVTLSTTPLQPATADESATPRPPRSPTPRTPVQAADGLTHYDHGHEDDMAPDVSEVIMATSALPSPVPARRSSGPSPTRSEGAASFEDDGEPIDISAIGAW
jgi:serine/threonine protein kinase